MEPLEVISLVSDILLTLIGIYLVIVIARVRSLYRSLGFTRTVMTPFLLVGATFAFVGVTELLEVFAKEIGSAIHSITILLSAIFLWYGLRDYHKMLRKAEESKRLAKISSKP